MSFRARYPGRCPAAECGEPIEVGDTLVSTEDGYAVHAECSGELPVLPLREVCSNCFIELPVSGICGVC